MLAPFNALGGGDMRMMISMTEAIDVIGDSRRAVLRESLESAWTMYESHVRPVLPLCGPRGMANCLHELIIQQVRDRFVGASGVVIHDHSVIGGRFLVEIEHRLMLSFKKLTTDFLTTNNPTAKSLAFDRQEPGIEGMSDLPRITVGYQLSDYGTAFAGIWLAFVSGKDCLWYYDLRTGSSSIDLDFPVFERSAADFEREERRRRETKRHLRLEGTNDGNDSAANDGANDDDDDPEVTNGG